MAGGNRDSVLKAGQLCAGVELGIGYLDLGRRYGPGACTGSLDMLKYRAYQYGVEATSDRGAG